MKNLDPTNQNVCASYNSTSISPYSHSCIETVLGRDMETFCYNRDDAYANRFAVLDEGLQLLMPSVRFEGREELVRWIYVWDINLERVGYAECRPLRSAWGELMLIVYRLLNMPQHST